MNSVQPHFRLGRVGRNQKGCSNVAWIAITTCSEWLRPSVAVRVQASLKKIVVSVSAGIVLGLMGEEV